jgi:hypothetical protein
MLTLCQPGTSPFKGEDRRGMGIAGQSRDEKDRYRQFVESIKCIQLEGTYGNKGAGSR